MGQSSSKLERVAVYVDGYNLYYGLNAKGWKRFLWLDLRQLFENEMGPGQVLTGVNYFTSLGRRQSAESTKRHKLYLAAIDATGGVAITLGKFETRPWRCGSCGTTHKRPQEKMTDVAFAVQLVADAHADAFDTAWLMCADADLIPAVTYMRSAFPEKVLVALPPRGRRSDELINEVGRKRDISRARHARAQLPDEVIDATGAVLRRPTEWQ